MIEQTDHKAAAARRNADREARRKAELMANMARRKAQVRGRAAAQDETKGADLPEITPE